MAVSSSFLTFVFEQLEGVSDVSSRRMFGAVGLYSGEWFFGIIDNDTLFFKVDDATREAYQREGMPPFHPMPDQPPMTGYYQVPPGVLEDRDVLATWARAAVAITQRGGTRKRRASRGTR